MAAKGRDDIPEPRRHFKSDGKARKGVSERVAQRRTESYLCPLCHKWHTAGRYVKPEEPNEPTTSGSPPSRSRERWRMPAHLRPPRRRPLEPRYKWRQWAEERMRALEAVKAAADAESESRGRETAQLELGAAA
jgi:hypothetical protein